MVEKFVWGLEIIPCSNCHKHVHVGAGHGECPTRPCHMNIHGGKAPLSFEIYTICMGMETRLLHPFCQFDFPFLQSPLWFFSCCEVHIPIATSGTHQRQLYHLDCPMCFELPPYLECIERSMWKVLEFNFMFCLCSILTKHLRCKPIKWWIIIHSHPNRWCGWCGWCVKLINL